MKPLVSVVIPCFNEQENVPRLWEKVAAVFATLPDYEYEILFVNDGSSDGTRAAMDALAAQDPHVRPLHLVRNMGQSAAVYAGMMRSRGDYVLTLDGDLQNDPADFPRFLELLQRYDCVCGYRAERHDALVRKVSSKVANAVRNWALRDGVRDSGCGAKGFRRACLVHLPPFNGLHRFMAVFIRAAGLSLVEAPVRHHARQFGVSKYGIGNRLWRGIYDLIGVRWLRRRFVAVRVEGEEPRV
ncbi:MAG: glycosyltransferase family 2 protein [Candidatus Hydrogenedentes bacterium]|nr:glycosyltransferase family 2 protein [Candidatus Hydrogenedentota bacterium]